MPSNSDFTTPPLGMVLRSERVLNSKPRRLQITLAPGVLIGVASAAFAPRRNFDATGFICDFGDYVDAGIFCISRGRRADSPALDLCADLVGDALIPWQH